MAERKQSVTLDMIETHAPPSPDSPDSETPSISFISLNGAFKGRRVFTLDAPIYLGRQIDNTDGLNPVNALRFPAKVVSRQHALIQFKNGKVYLQDTKSSSGTFLNGHRLSAQAQESALTEIHDGDILKLGEDCDVNGVLHSSIVMKVETKSGSGKADVEVSNVEGEDVSDDEDEYLDFSTDPTVKNHVDLEFQAMWALLMDGIEPPLTRLQAIIDGRLDPTAIMSEPTIPALSRLAPSGKGSSPEPSRMARV
ncbi:hypothetical protein SmJEL517_g06015 [Synchytrium microbalum]|uniref:FHA domain-containing protein n=1 Tax=Synchytrium microbalum TaxID=1806994 RepID=A0A507BSK0_9FUNG|nr:uncharacterized protein SmJEL517_g06015 [Synchytrium microbalum]TPX30418.1 hypothetical protein SmJEL517_g06015 [Synchytrium microbalum]